MHQVGDLFELNVKLRCQKVKGSRSLFECNVVMCCHFAVKSEGKQKPPNMFAHRGGLELAGMQCRRSIFECVEILIASGLCQRLGSEHYAQASALNPGICLNSILKF